MTSKIEQAAQTIAHSWGIDSRDHTISYLSALEMARWLLEQAEKISQQPYYRDGSQVTERWLIDIGDLRRLFEEEKGE